MLLEHDRDSIREFARMTFDEWKNLRQAFERNVHRLGIADTDGVRQVREQLARIEELIHEHYGRWAK